MGKNCNLSLASRSGAKAVEQVGEYEALRFARASSDGYVPSVTKVIDASKSTVSKARYSNMLAQVKSFNDTFGTNSYIEATELENGDYSIDKVVDNYSQVIDQRLDDNYAVDTAASRLEANNIRKEVELNVFERSNDPIDKLTSSTINQIDLIANKNKSDTQRYHLNEQRKILGLQPLGKPSGPLNANLKVTDLQSRIAIAEKMLGRKIVLSNDPKIKGRVTYSSKGEPIVDINAQLAESDTAFHEVIGHVFINAVGGLSDTRVSALAKRLERTGSPVWVNTIENNPDMSYEMQQLEAVAQSVGMAADQIFTAEQDISSFNRFMKWLAAKLNEIFDIQPEQAYALAREGFGFNYKNATGQGTFNQKVSGMKSFVEDMKGGTESTHPSYVKFNEEAHTYSKDGVIANRSATDIAGGGTAFIRHDKHITARTYAIGKASVAFISIGNTLAKARDMTLKEAVADPTFLAILNEAAIEQQRRYDMTAVWGTEVHAVYEDIIKGGETDIYRPEYAEIVADAKRYRDMAKDPNIEVVTEARLFDESTSIAGSVDLIIINKKVGTVEIVDFKTKKLDKFVGDTIDPIRSGSLDVYTKQLSVYGALIEKKYGVKVSKYTIQPVGLPFNTEYTDLSGEAKIQESIDLKARPAFDRISAQMGGIVGTRSVSTVEIKNISESLYSRIRENLRVAIKDKAKYNTADNKERARKQLDIVKTNFVSDEIATLTSYLEYLSGNIDFIDNILTNNDTNTLSIEELHAFKNKLSSLGVLDYIDEYIFENKESLEAEGILDFMQDTITDIRLAKQRHEKTILAASVKTLSTYMAGLSSISRVDKKDRVLRAFQEKNPGRPGKYMLDGVQVTKSEWKKARESHIFKSVEQSLDNVDKDNQLYWEKYLKDGYFDISSFEGAISDAISSESVLIQTVNKIFAKAELDSRADILEERASFDTGLKAVMDKHNMTIKQIHEIVTETDKDGLPTGMLLGEYSNAFYRKMRDYDNKINEMRDNGEEDSDEYKALRAERKKYRWKNTTKSGLPVAALRNPNYDKYKDIYNLFTSMASKADKKLNGNQPLGQKLWSVDHVFYKIPSVRHSTVEAALRHGVLAATKEYAGNLLTHRSDDESQEGVDEATQEIEDTSVGVNVGLDGTELKSVPIYFRGAVPAKEQSVDISTLLLNNYEMSTNFANKSEIQPTIELLVEVTRHTRPVVAVGPIGKVKTALQSSDNRAVRMDSTSNEFAQLQSVVEHRLYGIATKPGAATKVIQAISKYTANTMLIMNYMSGMNNLNVGIMANFIESAGNPYLNKASMLKATKTYSSDMSDIISDINKPVPTSKTNLLMEYFNIQGEFTTLGTDYFKDNMALKVLANGHSHALSSLGEHFIQAQLIYGILDGMKIMNASGKYLNAEGLVVSKANAASVNDVMEFKDGKPVYSTAFYTTSLNPHGPYNPLETSLYIQDTAAKLHGQYDDAQRSAAQRTAIGAAVFSLRKWIVRIGNQKWKGISTSLSEYDAIDINKKGFSEATQEFQEGRYTSVFRFFNSIVRSLNRHKQIMATPAWNKLNQTQQHNVIKSMYELAMTLGSLAASALFYGLHEEDPDDKALLFAAYMTRRMYSELAMFANPLELVKITRSPAVALTTVENVIKLAHRMLPVLMGGSDISEVYTRGSREGQLKIIKQFEGLVPYLKQYNAMDALDDKYKFMVNTF